MRSIMFIFTLCISFVALADFPSVMIQNFSGNYQDPEGSARADRFDFERNTMGERLKSEIFMKVLKEADGYLLTYEGEDFLFQNPPSLIYDVDKLNWQGIEVFSQKQKITFKVNEFNTQSELGVIEAKAIEGLCEAGEAEDFELTDKFLNACLTNAKLQVNSFHSSAKLLSNQSNDSYAESIFEALKSGVYSLGKSEILTGAKSVHAQAVDVKDLDLKIENHKFELKVTISGAPTIKAKGVSNYFVTSKTIQLEIKSVKAGWFGVMDKFFDELEKSNNARLRVDKPFIYIEL